MLVIKAVRDRSRYDVISGYAERSRGKNPKHPDV